LGNPFFSLRLRVLYAGVECALQSRRKDLSDSSDIIQGQARLIQLAIVYTLIDDSVHDLRDLIGAFRSRGADGSLAAIGQHHKSCLLALRLATGVAKGLFFHKLGIAR
jgi:hypothetical protein